MSEAFIRNSLFVPFQTTKKGGWGIGLYQAREIVTSHGGRMEIASLEGRGTTVTLHIPVVPLEWQIIANAMLGRDDRVDALAAHLLRCGYDRDYMANLFADPRIGARTIDRVRRALRFDR